MTWQGIETAPQDGKPIDLWAKTWLPDSDRFETRRFPDCRWDSGDSMCNRKPEWSGLPKGWRATHWMKAPPGPEASP